MHLAAILICLFLCLPAVGLAEQSAPGPDPVSVSLSDCVLLALQNNLDLRSSFLNRVVQRGDLEVAEYEFEPHTTIVWEGRIDSAYDEGMDRRGTGGNNQGSVDISLTIPTGGTFDFFWDNGADSTGFGQDTLYTSAWNIDFIQPLLKGGGTAVNTASLRIARINEEGNVLALKNSVMSLITSTIQAYRSYGQARQQLAINKRSLVMAEKLFEINQSLIAAGRMAEVELVQTEADIASRKVGILQSESSLDAARLALLRILNLDKDSRFETVDEAEKPVPLPSSEEAVHIALRNRPDYLQALLEVEVAKLRVTVARRDQLWDLSLTGGVGNSDGDTSYGSALDSSARLGESEWNAGLRLTIPVGDPAIGQEYVAARIGLEQALLNVKKMEIDIGIEVENALRDAEIRYRQLEMARRAVELSRRKLETETDKLNVGRSTNFQLLSYQNDLVGAESSALSALIDYLNLLTGFDQTLGTTLASWRIEVKKDDREVRLPEARGAMPAKE